MKSYAGTIIFVSHDKQLVDNMLTLSAIKATKSSRLLERLSNDSQSNPNIDYLNSLKEIKNDDRDLQSLAEAHGFVLTDRMNFNGMGIDFKVVFALDTKGRQWLLRIPRRDGIREQIKKNALIGKEHLLSEVPDWRISSTEFVALSHT